MDRSRKGSLAGVTQYTLPTPSSVRINVHEAFIDDSGSEGEDASSSSIKGIGGAKRPGTPEQTSDIALPNHHDEVEHIAVDIGGSLAKVVYFTRDADRRKGGRLNFKKFETEKIEECIAFLEQLLAQRDRSRMHLVATGGGSFKFYDDIKNALGCEVARHDEMECLVSGVDFFITKIPKEVFTYTLQEPMVYVDSTSTPAHYPYLVVNIGSGVSMLKVVAPNEFVRVGGSSLGGGTLWGLLSLLTDAKSYDEMLDMADRGDNTNVDMLVGDVYGRDYDRIGLKASTIASSMGKVFRKVKGESTEGETSSETSTGDASIDDESSPSSSIDRRKLFNADDMSRSLLYAISNNIGQISYLQAQRHQIEHIYFGGSYIRGHPQTMHTLSYAISFWSKGEKYAYFLRHEGYLGAVGAFLKQDPKPDWL